MDNKKYKILCISGGGIRGIIPATILQELEKEAGKSVTQIFDLVVGTSTGGIIAAGIATGMTPESITEMYVSEAKKIFNRSFLRKIRTGFGLLRSKYNNKGLYGVVNSALGDESISNSKVRFITTAYSTTRNRIEIFKSWKEEFKELSFTDVAMATSAAPTYFPPYSINNQNYIDGGIYANSPIQIAWIEGIKAGYDPKDIVILSLGTGHSMTESFNTKRWGVLSWLLKKGKTPLLNMVFDGVAEKDNHIAELMFDNFLYLDPLIPDTKMDEVKSGKLVDLYEIAIKTSKSLDYQNFLYNILLK